MTTGGKTWNGKILTHVIVSCSILNRDFFFVIYRTFKVMCKYTWDPDKIYTYYITQVGIKIPPEQGMASEI